MSSLEARRNWGWVKAYGVPIARYLGRGAHGTETLREELEAENEGLKVPSRTRWLGIKALYSEGTI